ncbi:MAG: hypothetical protein GC200_07650 [Tepidisphaera sp.]|nr:hypothetical protein [Tepidisphaera sp.]
MRQDFWGVGAGRMVMMAGLAVGVCGGLALGQAAAGAGPGGVEAKAAAGSAAGTGDASPSGEDPLAVKATLDLFGSYSATADFHNNRGSLSTARGGGRLGVRVPIEERRAVGFSFTGEYSNYDFSNASGFPGSAADGPWKDVTILTVEVNYVAPIKEKWSYFVGLSGDASYERGADFDKSLTLSGAGGVAYQVSDDLRLGFGLAAGSRLEDDPYVVPIVTVDWQIDEKWSLSSSPGFGSRTAGVELTYAVTEDLKVGLAAGFEDREFRLDRNGPIPSGVGRDYRLPVAVTAHWRVDPQVELSLGVGANVWGQVRAENSNGDRITEEDLGPGFFVGGRASFRF